LYLTLGNAPSRAWEPSVRYATLARRRKEISKDSLATDKAFTPS